MDVFLEKTSALGERATVDVSWHLCGSYEKFPEPEHRSRSAAAPRVSQRFSLSLWTSAESPQNPVVYLWDGQLEFCVWDRRRSQTSWTSMSRQQNSECVCVFYMGSLKKKYLICRYDDISTDLQCWRKILNNSQNKRGRRMSSTPTVCHPACHSSIKEDY